MSRINWRPVACGLIPGPVDFGVSFTLEQQHGGTYSFAHQAPPPEEAHGGGRVGVEHAAAVGARTRASGEVQWLATWRQLAPLHRWLVSNLSA